METWLKGKEKGEELEKKEREQIQALTKAIYDTRIREDREEMEVCPYCGKEYKEKGMAQHWENTVKRAIQREENIEASFFHSRNGNTRELFCCMLYLLILVV